MSSAIRVEIFDCSPEKNLKTVPVMELLFPSNRITVAELIRQRVAQEVTRYLAEGAQAAPLVEITEKERILNGTPKQTLETILLDLHCKRALQAFSANQFFLIVDDQQVTEPDEMIDLGQTTQVEFFRLRPLVGG